MVTKYGEMCAAIHARLDEMDAQKDERMGSGNVAVLAHDLMRGLDLTPAERATAGLDAALKPALWFAVRPPTEAEVAAVLRAGYKLVDVEAGQALCRQASSSRTDSVEVVETLGRMAGICGANQIYGEFPVTIQAELWDHDLSEPDYSRIPCFAPWADARSGLVLVRFLKVGHLRPTKSGRACAF